MRILVLGGTVFVGRHLVEAALADGHDVTLFTRGLTNPELFPQTEHLVGDRGEDVVALEGRTWDAVLDTSGFDPAVVGRSSKVLAGNVGIYAFISTISVYRNYGAPGIDEDSPVARLDDDELIARRDTGAYGPRKARCEEIVTEAFPEQTLTVRCGLIGGPHDNVGRPTYWPRRVAMGGEVLAPGAPGRMFQVIDARDLSEWVVRMVEQGRAGTFNAVGAATAFGTLLDVSKDLTGSDATFVWCTDQFLVEQGVAPQTELPLWSPVRPGSDGHYGISNERARAAGLALRPCRDTIRAVLDWAGDAPARAVGAGGAVGLSPDRERELLRAWRRS